VILAAALDAVLTTPDACDWADGIVAVAGREDSCCGCFGIGAALVATSADDDVGTAGAGRAAAADAEFCALRPDVTSERSIELSRTFSLGVAVETIMAAAATVSVTPTETTRVRFESRVLRSPGCIEDIEG
jgi:hypothetical protein